VIGSVLEDASHFPGGRAAGLVRPASELELAAALRQAAREGAPVLAIGAQSSLTGGAVPMGERVIATAGLARIDAPRGDTVTVQAGALLKDLQDAVGAHGWYYPPVPTYQLACVGGTVATNAAGSATFKYGPTRPWVKRLRALTVDGWLLELHRGEHVAKAGAAFEIALPDGSVRCVPVPGYPMPAVKKASLGYWSAPELDLIDLLIGSEGTLAVVTEVELGLVRTPAGVLAALVFAPDEGAGVELAGALRALDGVRAIEHMNGASLALVRGRKLGIPIPPDAGIALYVEMELADGVTGASILQDLEHALEGRHGATGPARLFATLAGRRLLDALELALPGEPARQAAFRDVREAVPMAVNETVRARRRDLDPSIGKLGGDMCVPFERFTELLAAQREVLAGLEHVVFGHISDGNVHPNILARSALEMERGRAALLALAARVKDLGGSPLAEHGVGRSPLKQRMLAEYHGPHALAEMRAIKRALDPDLRLARGVLFA
jgi:D-lactate dehydrogenase (cytochrome)